MRARVKQRLQIHGPCCIAARRYNAPMKTGSAHDRWLAALLLVGAFGGWLAMANAAAKTSYATEEIRIDALPVEAGDALARIRSGEAMPYERDGVVFGNREHLLPAKPRGYYREYTVKTRGAHTRGARRIVCGGAVASTAECYYSDDHYRSFKRIRQ
jgi:ribonuclease T1